MPNQQTLSPKRCAACGFTNRGQAKYCGDCGNIFARVLPAGLQSVTLLRDPESGLPMEVQARDGARMALIPAGEFWMGSREEYWLGLIRSKSDENPRHRVSVPAFYMDIHPVTVVRYRKFCQEGGLAMPEQPSWSAGDHPVVNVSWDEAQEYCKWAGKRLPSEAEWEKAARGGSEGKWCFGDDESMLGQYAWYDANSEGQSHPVSQKKPNQYGLYDMHGNVFGWTQDWYHDSYDGAPTDGSAWESPAGSARVVRGGSWDSDARYARAAIRDYIGPGDRYRNLGLRLAR